MNVSGWFGTKGNELDTVSSLILGLQLQGIQSSEGNYYNPDMESAKHVCSKKNPACRTQPGLWSKSFPAGYHLSFNSVLEQYKKPCFRAFIAFILKEPSVANDKQFNLMT